MYPIVTYMQGHWVEWLFGLVSLILAFAYKNIAKRLREEQTKSEAIALGVQSLLRESIIKNYNHYTEKGYMPIYAKESLRRVYDSYSRLGGNDVAKELYHKMLQMPEERTE